MKWILFTGTWRLTNTEVEVDVREAARNVFNQGRGIVTGGSTGVDFFAMDELFKLDPSCKHLQIYIPAKLPHYISDYRKNWKHAPITDKEIDDLEKLLIKIKSANPSGFFEDEKEVGDVLQADYDLRHDKEVAASDEVYAFQVNNSTGTQDTINKAIATGIPVTLHKKYSIEEKASN